MEKNHRLLSYFPKKHIFLLLVISLIFLFLFSFSTSKEKNKELLEYSLITEVPLKALQENSLTIEENNDSIIKESIIKINQIFHILKNLVNKNHVIAGYGASAKSVLVLNMLNIDRKVIKFFFDNSKNKINNCLPGTDIKIFSEKNINQFKFDYIILFAWNHFDEIYNKNKNKISKNIKWIIPNLKNKFIKIINNK